jgi:hypothetical protein
MSWSSQVSIERTDRILVFMSPVSLVAYQRQKLGLSLLLHWLTRVRNWVQTHGRSASVLWIMSGALFLGSSGIHPNLLVICERLLYIYCVRYVWSGTIRRLSVGCVCRVGRGFFCRLYIDSNHRNSRILVTACLVTVFT